MEKDRMRTDYTTTLEGPVSLIFYDDGTVEQRPSLSDSPPFIVFFRTNAEAVTAGEAARLSWEVVNADRRHITPHIGGIDPVGSVSLPVTDTTTYTLTASNAYGSVSDNVTITVLPKSPTITGPDGHVYVLPEVLTDQRVEIVHVEGFDLESFGYGDFIGSPLTNPITLKVPDGLDNLDVPVSVTFPPPANDFQTLSGNRRDSGQGLLQSGRCHPFSFQTRGHSLSCFYSEIDIGQ